MEWKGRTPAQAGLKRRGQAKSEPSCTPQSLAVLILRSSSPYAPQQSIPILLPWQLQLGTTAAEREPRALMTHVHRTDLQVLQI